MISTPIALSVHQPFAWAIVAGHKNIENRSWHPPAWLIGKTLLIHATKSKVSSGTLASLRSSIPTMKRCLSPEQEENEYLMPRGAIVGSVRLEGVVTSRDAGKSSFLSDPWWIGPVGWVLSNPCRFETPIPCKGRQRLWRVPREQAQMCRAEWRSTSGK